MILTRAHSIIAAIALLVSAGSVAGQPIKPSGSFTIDVKSTAAEQYAYASRITGGSSSLSERNETVLRSVAALEIIPKRWPNERALTIRAYGEIVSRLNGAQLYKNAIASCDEAIAYAGKTPQRLVFVAEKGRALMWLDRATDAQQAFDEATTGAGFDGLKDGEKTLILADAGFFHERQGNYRVAAQLARARATYSGDDFLRAEAIRKALDLSFKGGDIEGAKADLANLSEVALKARMRNLQPQEQDLLRRIDAAIVEYKKKLGGERRF
jgi:phosphosulfolactate phosphohydrolase-like enzyme